MKIVRITKHKWVLFLVAMGTCSATPVQGRRVYEAVVHICASGSAFNWLEPFKAGPTLTEQGSGFIIDDVGHIITNFHVIKDACEVAITMPACGQQKLSAAVVGICPESDIALLKLTPRDYNHVRSITGYMPYLMLADSRTIEREQRVVAYGYPFGQERVSSQPGEVSGFEVMEGESFIEVTTPLSSGYSGGPTVDSRGRVVGVNDAQIMGICSMNFIIPIDEVKLLLAPLKRHKIVHRPSLGAEFTTTYRTLMKMLGNPENLPGLYVTRVYKNGLFDRCGIRVGDVVSKLNGHNLALSGELKDPCRNELMPLAVVLNQCAPDDTLSSIVYRHGQKHKINIPLALTTQRSVRTWYPPFEPVDYEIVGGAVLMQLALNHLDALRCHDTQAAKKLFWYAYPSHQNEPRVVVTHLVPHSVAKNTGALCPGDLIATINGKCIQTLADVRAALKKKTRKKYTVITTTENAVLVLDPAVCALGYGTHFKSLGGSASD